MTSAAGSVENGRSVGGYRIERLLGRGETGAVYLAERAGQLVALKVIAPELCRSARFRQRFAGDYEVLKGLDHPNVLPVFDAGEAGGALFVAMRYVEGSDLGSVLGDGPLPAEQAIAIVEQVAGALHAAHCHGLVHRDLQPSNVLLEASTHRVFVTDFGLVGRTTDFAAPERIEGRRLDGRADVYSLGCVLAACLQGETWSALDRVVAKARAHAPEERYTTAVELAEAARAALASRPAPVEAPEPGPRPPAGDRRRNLVVAAAALLVAAGAAAALVASLGDGHSRPVATGSFPSVGPGIAAAVAAAGGALSAIPTTTAPTPAPTVLYDVVANSGGVGVRYRSSPSRWCGTAPPSDPCWRTVVPGTGAAEGQRLRVYCYATGADVHGNLWWAKVSVNPAEYVPAAFLRSAARYSSIAPPTSLRC